jgi:hypothetical protein
MGEVVKKAEVVFGDFLREFIPLYAQIVTNDNYIGLINILTYIPYNKWSDASYATTKEFLIHCFESINSAESTGNFPSISSLKSNSLVRLALIKLLGYISFCK